ncbi:MAG: hypothetical protein ACD_3C00049G0004 [uncultured bacterium (gcode 4)]|uniref:Uncharacterized protein n=1 Tax=uncultured bacterium (gcode 4) TaxID=1234023 RepID=K2G2N3_9BACT|nr:MAG: hypothetical protein ACD_3C00049G0004 [uncultured bacterium (gcode 4)]
MIKKILLIFGISFIFASQVFWNFSDISTYYLFFQNKNTNEQKYIETKSYGNWFFFNRYLLKYIDWTEIWWKSKLNNWNLIKIEDSYFHDNPGNHETAYSNSWVISVWNYWINFENKISTWSLSDVSGLGILTFQDITYFESIKIYFHMLMDLFWIWFLLFLPLNIIIFFCFWFLLFLLYERYWYGIFKNVYINSFFIYITAYLILIYSWLSFVELASGHAFWMSTYGVMVWIPKLFLYLISYKVFWIYHNKYPNKKILYKNIMYWYFMLFCLVMIISNIINR